jgi:RsiW-degrading membrane proteinase PrsW (M82 family)
MVTIGGLVVYALVVARAWPPAGGAAASPASGTVLALVPALLWLLLFYAQDVREPEPLGYVLRVAGAGALIASAVAVPALSAVRASPGTGAAAGLVSLAVMVGVIGSAYAFAVYLAVRYTVFDTGELDEPGDGVVYGTAAGVGVAAAVNVWLVLSAPAVHPLSVALWIVVVALGQAAFGGVLGYGLGRARLFGDRRSAVIGFVGAAVLHGTFAYVLREVTQAGLEYRPWHGLAVAAGIAVVSTVILLRVVRASSARDGATGAGRAQTGATNRGLHLDLAIWAVAVALFVAGRVSLDAVGARTTTFLDDTGRLRIPYPASWLPSAPSVRGQALLAIYDPQSGGAVLTALVITREPHDPARSASEVARDGALARSQRMPMYRMLSDRNLTVAGRDAVAIEYAYVEDPHATVLAARRLPVVMRGIEVVIPADGVVYRVDLRATEPVYARAHARFARMLAEARL